MRTGWRGRDKEIREMGVESGERRRVLGLLITAAPMGRKMNLEQNEEKGEGREVEEKRNGEYIHRTNNENSSHSEMLLI